MYFYRNEMSTIQLTCNMDTSHTATVCNSHQGAALRIYLCVQNYIAKVQTAG